MISTIGYDKRDVIITKLDSVISLLNTLIGSLSSSLSRKVGIPLETVEVDSSATPTEDLSIGHIVRVSTGSSGAGATFDVSVPSGQKWVVDPQSNATLYEGGDLVHTFESGQVDFFDVQRIE